MRAAPHATRARIRKTSSDAPCPGIAEAFAPDTCPDRSRAMIGGGAFLLLKTGSNGPGSSEQAEIPLAGFATILAFCLSGFSRGVQGRVTKDAQSEKSHSVIEFEPESPEYG